MFSSSTADCDQTRDNDIHRRGTQPLALPLAPSFSFTVWPEHGALFDLFYFCLSSKEPSPTMEAHLCLVCMLQPLPSYYLVVL